MKFCSRGCYFCVSRFCGEKLSFLLGKKTRDIAGEKAMHGSRDRVRMQEKSKSADPRYVSVDACWRQKFCWHVPIQEDYPASYLPMRSFPFFPTRVWEKSHSS